MLIEDQSDKNSALESHGLEIDFGEAVQEGYEPAFEDTDWMLDKRSKSSRGQHYVLYFWLVTVYMENNFSVLEFTMWKKIAI